MLCIQIRRFTPSETSQFVFTSSKFKSRIHSWLALFLGVCHCRTFPFKKEINQVEIILIAMHSMHYNAVQCAQSPGGKAQKPVEMKVKMNHFKVKKSRNFAEEWQKKQPPENLNPTFSTLEKCGKKNRKIQKKSAVMPHSVSKRKSRKRHLNTHIKTPRTENTGYLAAVKPNRSSRKQLPHLYVWLTEGRLIFTSLRSVLVRWQPTLPSANIPQTWKLYCFAHSLNSVKHLILQIYLYKGNITVFQSV